MTLPPLPLKYHNSITHMNYLNSITHMKYLNSITHMNYLNSITHMKYYNSITKRECYRSITKKGTLRNVILVSQASIFDTFGWTQQHWHIGMGKFNWHIPMNTIILTQWDGTLDTKWDINISHKKIFECMQNVELIVDVPWYFL